MNFGNIEVAKFLIEHGADVNIKDDKEMTYLSYAVMMNNIEMVKVLCEYGADVNIKDKYESTPLFEAVDMNNIEMVKVLCEYGADVNIINKSEITPLFEACENENIEMVKFLIDVGAIVNTKIYNDERVNAYSHGHNNKEIKKILVKNGINTDVEKFLKEREDTEEIKEEKLIKTNNIIEATPLTKILESKDTEALKILLHKGYDIQYVDIISLIKEDYPLEFIELVIAEYIDINIQDKDGNTALMVASKMNKLDIVNMLLKYNADVTIKNKNNEEAWELASNQEIRQILLDYEDEIVLNHQPKNLVKLLTNFTIDTPIKYTTHLWDFGDIKKEYGSFKGFIEAVSKQWKKIGKELKELSPNLHEKIYNFLLNTNNDKSWCSQADINIGWSSLEGLETWCNEGNNPFDFQLSKSYEINSKTITTFGEIINLFKREIEIRNENNMLESIFLEHQKKLGRKFSVELIKLKGRTFYTDVEKLQDAIGRIFEEIKKRDAYEIHIEVVEPNSESIELKIKQLNSSANRSSKEMLKEVNDGDFKIIKENLTNLCDWSIETNYEQGSYRVNYLRMSNIHEIEKPSNSVDGFTHILRFYKK